jgi:carbonic anhydrase/acetyltransferase-like protein (isoleucine patch superfamily)
LDGQGAHLLQGAAIGAGALVAAAAGVQTPQALEVLSEQERT